MTKAFGIFIDMYSMSPLVFALYSFYCKDPNIIAGIAITETFTKVIKVASDWILKDEESVWYKVTRRPIKDDCTKCDLLNMRVYKKGSAGFPSGHMAATVFFYTYLLLKGHSSYVNAITSDIMKVYTYMFLVFLMGVSRYMKNCHNVIQIVGGSFVGFGVSKLISMIS